MPFADFKCPSCHHCMYDRCVFNEDIDSHNWPACVKCGTKAEPLSPVTKFIGFDVRVKGKYKNYKEINGVPVVNDPSKRTKYFT